MKYIERLKKANKVYSGKAVDFRVDEIILPDGKIAAREFLDHPGAVAVLAFVDESNIVLVKQYRYPVGKLTYEVPAGKLAVNEDPKKCVIRELEEETGFVAGFVKPLLSFWPTPAFANELIHIYTAGNLKKTASSPDDDEFISSKVVPFTRALQWVKSGRIKDSKTLLALLYWNNFVNSGI